MLQVGQLPEQRSALPIFALVGRDVAGWIQAVGNEAGEFQPGDEIFGLAAGAWAGLAVTRATSVARKPPRWLDRSAIEPARVKLGERSYTIERPRLSSATAARREQRLAKNEVLFREVNERIEQAAEDASFARPFVFVCECSNTQCAETIEVTLAEYEAARSQPTLFLVAPGHEVGEIAQVLDRTSASP